MIFPLFPQEARKTFLFCLIHSMHECTCHSDNNYTCVPTCSQPQGKGADSSPHPINSVRLFKTIPRWLLMLASIQIVCLALLSHFFEHHTFSSQKKIVENARKEKIKYESKHKPIALLLHIFSPQPTASTRHACHVCSFSDSLCVFFA